MFSRLLDSEDDTLEITDCLPDDPVTIMYTSHTGVPKGAVLTHYNFWEQADLNGCYVLHINDQDRILTGAPSVIFSLLPLF